MAATRHPPKSMDPVGKVRELLAETVAGGPVREGVEAVVKVKDLFAQRLLNWFAAGDDETEPTTTVSLPSDAPERDAAPGEDPAATRRLPLHQLPPAMAGRYEVAKVLGKGSFGVVYLARDRRIGRLLAIKQLYRKHTRSGQIYQQFLQEARIAGQLDNPNIVTIFDVTDDPSPCILMEYLSRGNLATIIKLDAPLPELTALTFLRGIMHGLQGAHRMGVVHRDIKPQNILFDQSGIPKISDFGIAHLPSKAGGRDVTAGQIVGTPDYMAPEQMLAQGTVDERADLYAAGLLFYEMLTGKRYFHFGASRDIVAMLAHVRQIGPPRDEDFPATVSECTRLLVRHLVRVDPQDRLPDARTVLGRLDELIASSSPHRAPDPEALASHQVRREMFADILRLFLVDGLISAPERRELNQRAERLGISAADARDLEELVRAEFGLPLLQSLREYERRLEHLLDDGQCTPQARAELQAFGQQQGISPDEQRKIEEELAVRQRLPDGIAEELRR